MDINTDSTEFDLRFYPLFLVLGIAVLGTAFWGVSEGVQIPLITWIAGFGVIAAFGYWERVPVVKVEGDRLTYALAPLRSAKVVNRDFAAEFEYRERTLLSDQFVVHQQSGDPVKINAGQIKKDERPRLIEALQDFCASPQAGDGEVGQPPSQGPSPLDLT